MIRAPRFWEARSHPAGVLLTPLGELYGRIVANRARKPGVRPGIPVICVGNVRLGGSGKTPTVRWLYDRLDREHRRPVILMRGHGGLTRGPQAVRAADTAMAVGDEAAMLGQDHRVVVARDRVAGARLIEGQALGGTIVMDDGFQSPGLAKDLSLLIFDGPVGLGNGRVFPAGPLREPLPRAVERADAALVIGADPHGLRDTLGRHGLPVFEARMETDTTPLDGIPAYAFAGIGRPPKFFAALRAGGVDLRGASAFADHHPYSSAQMERLVRHAETRQARLTTTRKDIGRVPAAYRPSVQVIDAVLRPADEAAFTAWILERLNDRRAP